MRCVRDDAAVRGVRAPLFVTTMELAVFASQVKSVDVVSRGCAYQVDGLCSFT
jgi:hypothetical protein